MQFGRRMSAVKIAMFVATIAPVLVRPISGSGNSVEGRQPDLAPAAPPVIL